MAGSGKSTLCHFLREQLLAHGIEAPAIVAIGQIVRLRDGLDWLGALEGRVLKSDPLGLKADRRVG